MKHKAFSGVVRLWCNKNYGSMRDASKHFGFHPDTIARSGQGLRRFPKALLDEMGYEAVTPSPVDTVDYKKAKIEEVSGDE